MTEESDDDQPVVSFDWIVPGRLAIGNFAVATDRALLSRLGIRSILGLVPTLSGVFPEDVGVEQIRVLNLTDDGNNTRSQLEMAIEHLCDLAELNPPVLVHCHAGRSRSVIVAAAWLGRTTQCTDADEALALVAARRETMVHPDLVAQLRTIWRVG